MGWRGVPAGAPRGKAWPQEPAGVLVTQEEGQAQDGPEPRGLPGVPEGLWAGGLSIAPCSTGIHHRPEKASLTTGRHPGGGAVRGAVRPRGLLKSPSRTRGTVYATEQRTRKPPVRLEVLGENTRHKHFVKVWEDGMRQSIKFQVSESWSGKATTLSPV